MEAIWWNVSHLPPTWLFVFMKTSLSLLSPTGLYFELNLSNLQAAKGRNNISAPFCCATCEMCSCLHERPTYPRWGRTQSSSSKKTLRPSSSRCYHSCKPVTRLESSFFVTLHHLFFAVCLKRLFDKSEQVLLVHGGGSVDVSVHLDETQVVEV